MLINAHTYGKYFFSFFIFFMYEKARNELGTTVHLPVELGEILLTIPS